MEKRINYNFVYKKYEVPNLRYVLLLISRFLLLNLKLLNKMRN